MKLPLSETEKTERIRSGRGQDQNFKAGHLELAKSARGSGGNRKGDLQVRRSGET